MPTRTGRIRERERALGEEVGLAFRVMLGGVLCNVALAAAVLGWLIVAGQPRVDRLEGLVAAVEDAHIARVDQETGLRAYLATGQREFLEPYTSGVRRAAAADTLTARLARGQRLGAELREVERAQQRWAEDWAVQAADPLVSAGRVAGVDRDLAQVRFFAAGKSLFDAYRAADQRLLLDARATAAQARLEDAIVLGALCATLLATGAVVTVATVHRRRRLRARVIGPVAELLCTVRNVAGGVLAAPPPVRGAAELVQLRDGLAEMTDALAAQRQQAREREAQAAETARRQRHLLGFARQVSGSTDPSPVLAALAGTAAALTDGRARVWLHVEGDARLLLAADSAADTPADLIGARPPGSDAERAAETDALTLPLVVGARVVGMLELPGAVVPAHSELLTQLEALAAHAANAVEAARLFAQAAALSTTDALTGLGNRRHLDEDLHLELQRSARSGQALALLLLDLDDFKKVNDTLGHQQGDLVLQQVAQILTAGVRAGDSVYRYGGEELVVLLRETDGRGAWLLAERLRESVAASFAGNQRLGLTVSGGVAVAPDHGATAHALLGAADAALYAAKDAGRNRVTTAPRAVGPSKDAPVVLPEAHRRAAATMTSA